MNAILTSLPLGMMSLLILSLGSCSVLPPPVGAPSPDASLSGDPSPGAPSASSSPSASPSSIAQSPSSTVKLRPSVKTTTIYLYKADNKCAALTPEKVTIAAKQSLEGAIAKVLEETDSGDFTIAGYRILREGERAIVDLRLPANAKRQFRSLSSCEQLALFGGIRKTLIDNSQWNIKSVQFTEKGEEIVL